MGMLFEEKKQAIIALGFGGLLQLLCKEVRFNLCHWIITHSNVLYHHVVLGPNKLVNITLQDVSDVLGVPSEGIVINFVNRRSRTNRKYCLRDIERDLLDQPVGEQFLQAFLIFTYATILVLNTKQEGIRDICDQIWYNDLSVHRNWASLALTYLENDIHEFQTGKGSWFEGCIPFLQVSDWFSCVFLLS